MWDLGGSGPALHLAPANGFPPQAYNRLAAQLAKRFHVLSLDPRPLWPGSDPVDAPTWHTLADDLVCGLDALGLQGLVGVGHSIGGVLTLWAAIQRPDLFRAVVLIDPVLLPRLWLWAVCALRCAGLSKWQPLVRAAGRRRWSWPSQQACYEQLRGKPLFARWADAAVWEYVEAGTRVCEGGRAELAYPPEWEAHIFATVPCDAWRGMERLRTPALFVRGDHSDTFRQAALARARRAVPGARCVTIAGAGHLAPLERPQEVAGAICAFLGPDTLD